MFMFFNSFFAALLSVIPRTASTWVGFRAGKFLNDDSCEILGVNRF